jgi:hypothetical protein
MQMKSMPPPSYLPSGSWPHQQARAPMPTYPEVRYLFATRPPFCWHSLEEAHISCCVSLLAEPYPASGREPSLCVCSFACSVASSF